LDFYQNLRGKCLKILIKKFRAIYLTETRFMWFFNTYSELTFFGELRQIPIKLSFKQFDYCLLTRAIVDLP